MTSMEEIIEMFADSISGFIMLSIKLQEDNAKPQDNLKQAAGGVVQATGVLETIARSKAQNEYEDYEDIQSDLYDCVDQVAEAVREFPKALQILFDTNDRSEGWQALVRATQKIATQVSRMLLTVYGAEHRRLQMAGELLLETCAKQKPFAGLSVEELSKKAKEFVEGTNALSSDTAIFTSYVGARAKEIDGPKAARMARAVVELQTENNNVVNSCNNLLKDQSKNNRTAYATPITKIEEIVRDVLDMIKKPEELDVFHLIQSMYAQPIKVAEMSQAQKGRKLDTTFQSLLMNAEAAKKAIRKVGRFEQNSGKDNATDKLLADAADASAQLARFMEHLRAKAAEVKDAQQRKILEDQLKVLDADNKQLVGATNAYCAKKSSETADQLSKATRKALDDIDATMAHVKHIEQMEQEAARAKKKGKRGFEDEIDSAADDIKDAADEYKGVPAPLKDAAIELSELMAKLADCARNGDRAGIIACAREISTVIKKIQKQSKEEQAKCKDPRLAEDIALGASALGNFGMQLKILASVKAANVGADPEAEMQLVSCCEGVASSMRQTLYGIGSSNIGSKKKAGPRFRKNTYV